MIQAKRRAGLWAASGPLFPPDANASAYILAVEAADGAVLENRVKWAINDFVAGCKLDGTWAAIKACCILNGARTLAGALVPLVGPAPTNQNFISTDYNRKNGLTGNGTNKRLNANRNNAVDPISNRHLAVFTQGSVPNGATQGIIGTGFSNTMSGLIIDVRSPSGLQPWLSGLNFPGGMAPLTTQSGFMGASRSNIASVIADIGGVSYTRTINVGPGGASETYVFYALDSGNYYTGAIKFYSTGGDVNFAQYRPRVNTLISSIAAGIP